MTTSVVAEFLCPKGWLEAIAGPKYVRLCGRIEQGIEDGLFVPETPLPPERKIADLTGLSRVTVRKAMALLVRKGAVLKVQGSGSFVAGGVVRLEQPLSRLTSFTEDMARRGMRAEAIWLKCGVFVPSPAETVALGLSPGDSVARISRIRLADGSPMAIERASLPLEFLPDPLAVTRSLYATLEKNGFRPVRALQKISAINLGAEDAELLGVEVGSAGMKIERTSYLRSDRVVEFTRSVYRGDIYDFVAELRLPAKP